MIMSIFILLISIYNIYCAYKVLKTKDVSKANRDIDEGKIKDLDSYIKWYFKWGIISGVGGVIFVLIELINRYVYHTGYLLVLMLVVVLVSIFYPMIYEKKIHFKKSI